MGSERAGSAMGDPGTEAEEALPGKPRRAQGLISAPCLPAHQCVLGGGAVILGLVFFLVAVISN